MDFIKNPRMAFRKKSIQHFTNDYAKAADYKTPVFCRYGKTAGIVVVASTGTPTRAVAAATKARASYGFGAQPAVVHRADTKRTSTPTRGNCVR